jgi:hypothetical protein
LEAEALGLSDDLAVFFREDSATADALTYCDMTTSPTGQRVTLTERLAEIAERYGAEHLVVRCLQRAHDHLASTVQRTEKRLRTGGVLESSGDGRRGSVLQEVLDAQPDRLVHRQLLDRVRGDPAHLG